LVGNGAPGSAPEVLVVGSQPAHGARRLRGWKGVVIRNVIDFIPEVATYESDIVVDLSAVGDSVHMVVTLDAMHSDEFTRMQQEGFTSQLTKLDARFTRTG
jgi:hypothetical protein